jgi:peptide/nickel transport system permease protein
MTFLVRRAAQGLLLVFLTTTLTFFLIHAAPGEPFAELLSDPRATDAMREAERARFGLDRPIAEQYGRFLLNVARGDLGTSFTYRRPVASVLAEHLPRTLALMGVALTLGFAGGILLGALQAARAGGWFDRLTGGAAVLIAAIPDFWLALLALLLFAVFVPLFPVSGLRDPTLPLGASPWTRAIDLARHFVLPAGTLALLIGATISRYQRAALIEVLPETYLRTARAKGVPSRRVILHHGLRNALLPIITLGGLAVPALLGGAVFVEVIFAWPGMGSLAARAVEDRDYPIVMAVVILSSVLVVVGSLLADLAQAASDPRQRHA